MVDYYSPGRNSTTPTGLVLSCKRCSGRFQLSNTYLWWGDPAESQHERLISLDITSFSLDQGTI